MKKIFTLLTIMSLFILAASDCLATTQPVKIDFGNVTCPAWCCYAWRMRVYEVDCSYSNPRLIDTEWTICSKYSYNFTENIDAGYCYVYCVVDAVGSSVCDPAPPYQNWSSYPPSLDPVTGSLITWYPKIC